MMFISFLFLPLCSAFSSYTPVCSLVGSSGQHERRSTVSCGPGGTRRAFARAASSFSLIAAVPLRTAADATLDKYKAQLDASSVALVDLVARWDETVAAEGGDGVRVSALSLSFLNSPHTPKPTLCLRSVMWRSRQGARKAASSDAAIHASSQRILGTVGTKSPLYKVEKAARAVAMEKADVDEALEEVDTLIGLVFNAEGDAYSSLWVP